MKNFSLTFGLMAVTNEQTELDKLPINHTQNIRK